MPVRNGKWVSWFTVKEAAKQLAEAAPEEPEPEPEPEPKARRPRRSKVAAEAAIADATGAEVTLDEPVLLVDADFDFNEEEF